MQKSDDIFSKIILAARYFFDTKKNPEERFAMKRQMIYDIYFSDFPPIKQDAAVRFITYLLRLTVEMDRKLTYEFYTFFEKEEKLMGVTERGIPKFFRDIYQIEREKGEEIGEKRGEKKGDYQARLEIARELLASEMQVEMVQNITKLPMEEIKALVKEKGQK